MSSSFTFEQYLKRIVNAVDKIFFILKCGSKVYCPSDAITFYKDFILIEVENLEDLMMITEGQIRQPVHILAIPYNSMSNVSPY